MSQKTTTLEVTSNVIGFFDTEEDCWCALSLEMDLRGYGDNFGAALDDLQDSIAMQIGFAHFKGNPNMAFRPAEPSWFQLFAQLRQESLISYPLEPNSDYRVGSAPMPPAHVIDEIRKGYIAANG